MGPPFLLSVRTRNPESVIRVLATLPEFARIPMDVAVDDDEHEPSEDWLDRWGSSANEFLQANWWGPRAWLIWQRDGFVKCAMNPPPYAFFMMELLQRLDFEEAFFGSIHDWTKAKRPYTGPHMTPHYPLGLACAFKGIGHERLVSRRFIKHGLWRLMHGAGDLTIIQFHDFYAEPETALAQARRGHERIQAGYLDDFRRLPDNLEGTYIASERLWRIEVLDDEPEEEELFDAVLMKRCQPLGADKPIERVAYFFPDSEVAAEHVQQLWLREIECWTMIDGRETLIGDSDYMPVDMRAPWMREI